MAGEYQINFSNPSKGQFIIQPNAIDGPGYTNHHTSLQLHGRYIANYGVIVATNFVKLLENFANVTPPSDPTIGQTWFRLFTPTPDVLHGDGILHVYNPSHPEAGDTGFAGWLAVGSGLDGGSGGAGAKFAAAVAGNFTAVAGSNYFINTTSAAVSVTLPAAPAVGDVVGFVDMAGTFHTNSLFVLGNGALIMGDPTSMENNVRYSYFRLAYSGPTFGWRLIA